MTRVALLWHMHQPYYEDLVTREHILPWVRLHALKDYYGMVALLREFSDRAHDIQPGAVAARAARGVRVGARRDDRYLDIGLKPAVDLVEEEASFMAQNFFHAQRHRMIDIYPRYAELLALRGPAGHLSSGGDRRAALRRFSVDDLRDLQVWQKLAWIDPLYLDRDDRVRDPCRPEGLVTSRRTTRRRCGTVELELLNAVIPEYRVAGARGQIEI